MTNIDVETIMNDKKLLLEQVAELEGKVRALNIMNQALLDELAATYDQVYSLTAEVNRLTDIVEGSYDH